MKNNILPKFHETFNPILNILKDGETITNREMQNRVISKFFSHLPENLMSQTTKSGDPLINNRIAWGKSYLKKGGYVSYPVRGSVKITEKGFNQTSELSLAEIEGHSNLLQFYKHERSKTIETTDSTLKIQNASPQDLIDEGFTQIESQTKGDLLEKLRGVDPYYFEKVILILLKKMGYGEFIETAKSGDGGIDGIINEDKLGLDKIYIQAKRFLENKVREKDIRNFIGAMSGDTNKGVFVTTSSFDAGAIKKANDAHHKIILLDGLKLVELMHEFNVGVQIKSTLEIKQLDEDFFEER